MAAVLPRRENAPTGMAWLRHAGVQAAALVVAGILAVHAPTAASVVAVWMRSETFTHGFVVVPIALWLAWRRRADLEALDARPWYPALAIVALAGGAWLLSTLADVDAGRHFALAFMLQAGIVAVVGLRVARALAFPLAFLLFAVPFGEFMVPTMIDWTADFTVMALQGSGVPVYREANHFIIPSGSWSVVEACSGIRYLIVSVMVGTLYAMVSYRTTRLRVAFIAASIAVPLVANWLRAYGIVMLGHLSNNRLAVGVDHLIYGWIFFGVVMALLFWVGGRWQDREPAVAAMPIEPAPARVAPVPRGRLFVAALAAIAVATLFRPLPDLLVGTAPRSGVALAPVPAGGGWLVESPAIDWKPRYVGASAELRQGFRKGDAAAGLHVVFYRDQQKGRELVTSTNALVPKSDWQWKEVGRGTLPVTFDGSPVTMKLSTLSGPSGSRLLVAHAYWVDGRLTTSDIHAKLLTVGARLRGHGDPAALVAFYAPADQGDERAKAALAELVDGASHALARTLAAAAGVTR